MIASSVRVLFYHWKVDRPLGPVFVHGTYGSFVIPAGNVEHCPFSRGQPWFFTLRETAAELGTKLSVSSHPAFPRCAFHAKKYTPRYHLKK